MPCTLDDQIKEVNRELAMRLKVYPDLIHQGRLSKKDANQQYKRLRSVKASLMRLVEMEYGKQAKLEM